MTARPIGAATLPPVAPRPRSPPSSTITATAIVGFSAGANATYQACGVVFFGSSPCSAVPVFDAICDVPQPALATGVDLGLDHHVAQHARRSSGSIASVDLVGFDLVDRGEVRAEDLLAPGAAASACRRWRWSPRPPRSASGVSSHVALADAALVERGLVRQSRPTVDGATGSGIVRSLLADAELRRLRRAACRRRARRPARRTRCCRTSRAPSPASRSRRRRRAGR